MNEILAILIPIIVGAVIGWITNALAIRMLFRPYKAWYLGPLKIPFTPGIIPRQRERLAVSLGRMVSVELFQTEGLIRHLRSPEIQDLLHKTVAELSSKLFAYSPKEDQVFLEKTQSGPPEEVQGFFIESDFSVLGERAFEVFIQSPRFEYLFTDAFSRLVQRFLDQEIFGKEGENESFIRRELGALSQAASLEEGLNALWRALCLSWRERGVSLKDIFGTGGLQKSSGVFDALYPKLLIFVHQVLAREDIRRDLEQRSLRVLTKALDSLSSIQRNLLKIGGYDSRLKENLPSYVAEAIKEIEAFLSQESNKEALKETLFRELQNLIDLALPDLEERFEFQLEDLGRNAIRAIASWVQKGTQENDTEESEASKIFDLLFKGVRNLTWRQVFSDYALLDCDDLVSKLRKRSLDRLRQKDIHTRLWRGFASLFMKARESSLAQNQDTALIVAESPSAGKNELDDLSTEVLLQILERVVPRTLERFNLQGFVEARVAELNMAELEKLILGLVGREFAWINIFGAILGGLIGLIQIGLRNFFPGV